MNYYELLEITQEASVEEVKIAYKKMAKLYHPDIVGNNSTVDKFKQAVEAYETLSDPHKRAVYNAKLPKIKPKLKPEPENKVKPFFKFNRKTGKIDEIWPPGFGPTTRAVDPNMGKVMDAPPPTVDIWGEPIVNEIRDAFVDSVSYFDNDSIDIR